MRTLRLSRQFDAVFVHDAVMYMTSLQDLHAAVRTAFVHCRPSGVAVFAPDSIGETFAPSTDCGGSDGPEGVGARLLEWTWDPDPNDSLVRTDYVFLLRGPDRQVEVVHETHVNGVFTRDEWRATLDAAGFSVEEVAERTVNLFRGIVPEEVPGIAFLSGGQTDEKAAAHLNAMQKLDDVPWELTFSYGRALIGSPLKVWSGDEENVQKAQEAFAHRAKCNAAARQGEYSEEMEKELVA
jgi:hypothetical protein